MVRQLVCHVLTATTSLQQMFVLCVRAQSPIVHCVTPTQAVLYVKTAIIWQLPLLVYPVTLSLAASAVLLPIIVHFVPVDSILAQVTAMSVLLIAQPAPQLRHVQPVILSSISHQLLVLLVRIR
jgi:hypothetical protein